MPDDRPVFEVELTGPDGRHTDTERERQDRSSSPTGRFGRPTTTAAISATMTITVITAVIIAVIASSDDGIGTDTATAVTTVPVLPTLPRLDATDESDSLEADSSPATTNTSFRPPRWALSGEPIVDLPSPTHTGGFTVGSFILSERSIDALDDDLPRRSTTDHVVGAEGFRQRVVITNDPSTGRYRLDITLRVDDRTDTASVIIDLVDGVTWLPTGPDGWTSVPNDDIAGSAGATSMADYLRRLQLGPLRSDTRPSWRSVESRGLVDYPGEDEPLAEWVVTTEAGAVPVWSRYALGPLGEAAPLASDAPVVFSAFVTSDGALRRVTGESVFGSTTERIDHQIAVLAKPVTIELPTVPDPGAPDTAPEL